MSIFILIVSIVFSLSISSVYPLSNQEDLSITSYFHSGCLNLNPDKEFLLNHQQDDDHQSYQIFSSSIMTIELCFRLCRRWTILINQNQCICLYTMTKKYEFQRHLGDIRREKQCPSTSLNIYSLTKEVDLLPPPPPADDWALDGCYYMDVIQIVPDKDYNSEIEICRHHCKPNRNWTHFSFLFSLNKICYCPPFSLQQNILPLAIRKPLIHCSFLPAIKSAFSNNSNSLGIHSDTIVKIDVQRYCNSEFSFDRYFYLCLKATQSDSRNNYSKIDNKQICSPMLIKTVEDLDYWNNFITNSSSFRLGTPTSIWIDQSSTYLINNYFKNKTDLFSFDHICLNITRDNNQKQNIYELVSCSKVPDRTRIFCAQKPLRTALDEQTDLQVVQNNFTQLIEEDWRCPSKFFLFNGICYFVYSSFVDNLQSAKQNCITQHQNSTLVQFNTHQEANGNATRFFGRNREDILLEIFYYVLERKSNESLAKTTQEKHWLRLLLATRNDPNGCVLRYFNRSSGSFTTRSECHKGGHPVCQTHRIRRETTTILPMTSTSKESIIDSTMIPTSGTTTDNPRPIPLNVTDIVISLDDTNIDNFTTVFVPDEDLSQLEMNISITNGSDPSPRRSRSLPLIIIGSILSFFVLLISVILVICYVREDRGRFSSRLMSLNSFRRQKHCPSPMNNSADVSTIPAVVYNRLPCNNDYDLIQFRDPSIIYDDYSQLLPRSVASSSVYVDPIKEDEEEFYYAVLGDFPPK